MTTRFLFMILGIQSSIREENRGKLSYFSIYSLEKLEA